MLETVEKGSPLSLSGGFCRSCSPFDRASLYDSRFSLAVMTQRISTSPPWCRDFFFEAISSYVVLLSVLANEISIFLSK